METWPKNAKEKKHPAIPKTAAAIPGGHDMLQRAAGPPATAEAGADDGVGAAWILTPARPLNFHPPDAVGAGVRGRVGPGLRGRVRRRSLVDVEQWAEIRRMHFVLGSR